ncbi:MAG: hypothetical protein U0821_10225 [Chloroflexota bacterium]
MGKTIAPWKLHLFFSDELDVAPDVEGDEPTLPGLAPEDDQDIEATGSSVPELVLA